MKKDNTTTNINTGGTGMTYVKPTKKQRRNDACFCGSGLKYKNCHLVKQIIKKV